MLYNQKEHHWLQIIVLTDFDQALECCQPLLPRQHCLHAGVLCQMVIHRSTLHTECNQETEIDTKIQSNFLYAAINLPITINLFTSISEQTFSPYCDQSTYNRNTYNLSKALLVYCYKQTVAAS